MSVEPWATLPHARARAEPGRVQAARAHDLRTRVQLHSASSVTCYILNLIFYSSELCNIGMWTRKFDFRITFRVVLGDVYSEWHPLVASETRYFRVALERQLDLENNATTEWSRSDCLNWEWYAATAECELGAMRARDLLHRNNSELHVTSTTSYQQTLNVVHKSMAN